MQQGCQVEVNSKERTESLEWKKQSRVCRTMQGRLGKQILQVLWSFNKQWLAPASVDPRPSGLRLAWLVLQLLFACFCLSFAAKTSASLSPAGLCALFHFQFNRIDVARLLPGHMALLCLALAVPSTEGGGREKEDCQEAISFSCGPLVPPASCERQAWRILSGIFKLKCLMFFYHGT